MSDASERYSDIIDLEYRKSSVRPHMAAEDRAAQFAPFAALVGFSEVISDTARRHEERMEQMSSDECPD